MDIFNELKEMVGCRYISDMRYNEDDNRMAKICLKKIDTSKYTEKEIRDVNNYLYDDNSYLRSKLK